LTYYYENKTYIKMTGRSHSFYKNYLKFTAIVVGAFGPIFFLGTAATTDAAAAWTLDFLHWPIDGNQTYEPTTRFLSALTGGFLTGWGVTIWLLATKVYDKAPEMVRLAVLAGILSWFVVDSTGSYIAGATSNVFFNTLILLIAVGPMWRPSIDTTGHY
jgi:hypothetical protein